MISRLCMHLRKVGSETTVLLGDSTVKRTWGTSASGVETEASALSLAFLQLGSTSTGATASEQTVSFGSASTSQDPVYCEPDLVANASASGGSTHRLSGITLYCDGGDGSSTSGLEAGYDWKGKGKATILEESDVGTGLGGWQMDDTGPPSVPGVLGRAADWETPRGDWDGDARANDVERNASRNTLELTGLVRAFSFCTQMKLSGN